MNSTHHLIFVALGLLVVSFLLGKQLCKMNFNEFFCTIYLNKYFLGNAEAWSCQEQRNGFQEAMCVRGHCPEGYRRVFWNSGCSHGEICCI